MTPNSGIYLLVHLVILGAVRFFGFLRSKLLPSVIVALVIIAIYFGSTQAVSRAWLDGNNLAHFQNLTHQCEEFYRLPKQKKIIIRVDDIQAYWLSDIQENILSDLEARQLPASISVIPIGLMADEKMTRFLRQHDCHFDYTLHGFDQGRDNGYQNAEFALLSEEEAGSRIDQGLEILKEVTDDEIVTFVPPNNRYSLGTRQALLKRGFRVVSAERGGFFDYAASTYNYAQGKHFTKEETYEQCQDSLAASGLCVLMIHPQDFTQDGIFDQARYNEFLSLLDMLEKLDVEFTDFASLKNWYHTIPLPPEERNFQIPEKVMQEKAKADKLVDYKQVLATKYWVGEVAGVDNGFIANDQSAWDNEWQLNYGGIDDPLDRCGDKPCGFKPKENPYYVALPYNDLDEHGKRKASAALVPWAASSATMGSILKNRWVELKYKDQTCYAQWEDVGPFYEDDFDYVFKEAEPKNKIGVGAGIDLSPATWDCLGLFTNSMVNWRFVDDGEVLTGPWQEVKTSSVGYKAILNNN